MKLKERVKGIIFSPENEWKNIQAEQINSTELFSSYLLPLLLIPAIAGFFGYGIIGQNIPFIGHVGSVSIGLKYTVTFLVNIIASVYMSSYAIDHMAPNFSASRNFNRSFQLVVYSYTPAIVAGALYILPSLSILVVLASLYSLYLLYLGLKPLMAVPEEKTASYFIVSLIIMTVSYIIVSALMNALIIKPSLSISGNINLP